MKKKFLRSMTMMAGIGAICVSTIFPSFAGTWREEGWKYYGDDGKAMTSWVQVGDKWYYFDKTTGNMKTGWLLDTNNKWYFLNTVPGSNLGEMLTGWQWIDGYCYNFLPDGSMEHSVITVEGYVLNETGQWASINGVAMYDEEKGISSNNLVTVVEESQTTTEKTASTNTGNSTATATNTSAGSTKRPASRTRTSSSRRTSSSSSSSSEGSGSSSSSSSSGSNSSSSSSGGSSSSSSSSGSGGSGSGGSSSSGSDANSGATS